MTRTQRTRVAVVVGLMAVAGAGPATRPSAESTAESTATVVKQCDRAVAKAGGDYAAAVRGAHVKCAKQLDEVVTAATHRGDLDAAVAARDEVSRQRKLAAEAARPAGQPADAPPFAGAWDVKWSDAGPFRVTFTGTTLETPSLDLRGTLKREGPSWVVTWPSGKTDHFTPTADGDRLLCEQWETAATSGPPARFGIGNRAAAKEPTVTADR